MDVEFLPLISRWLHILAAIVLMGGTVFLRFTVVPVLNNEKDQESWFAPMRSSWSKLVMMSILFLLASGLYNTAIKSMTYELVGGPYLILLSIKILLALVIFFLVSVLSGRSRLAVKFRSEGSKWYNLTIAAMLLLVCVAGYMKSTPVEIKEKPAATASIIKNY